MIKNSPILIALFCCISLFAQEPIRYTTKQGLPTNHVYDIAEDANGFMWFATKQGVVKFDGETFKTFTIQDGLPNNDTWRLETDYRGRLWYFSKSAYQGYLMNDSIYKFSTKEKDLLTPRFYYKSTDNFWFYSNNVNTIKNDQIIDLGLTPDNYASFQLELKKKYGYDYNISHSFLLNPENKEIIFININDEQLLVYDWGFKFKHTTPITLPVENPLISSQFIASGVMYNQIGYIAYDTGVMFVDFKNNTSQFISFKDLGGVEKPMYFKCKSLANEFQISIPGHLTIFDYQLNALEKFTFPEPLSQYSYKDSRGNLWLTDISKGISLIPNTQLQTPIYFKGLKVQKVNGNRDNLFLGVNNKGFYNLNTTSNKEQSLVEFNIPHSEIYQIKKDSNQNQYLFVAAHKSYGLKNNNFHEFQIKTTKNNILLGGALSGGKDILYFNKSYYCIISSALIKYKPEDKYSKYLGSKIGLQHLIAFNNKIYAGGSDGLSVFKNDSLVKPKLQNDLLNVPITSLSSSNENLLVGTDGRGVYLYNEDQVFHLKETDGLSVQKIIKEEDTLWLATQKGVKKIGIIPEGLSESKILDAYYTTDGLLQDNTNDIYKQDSLLYVASDIGLAKINLDSPIYTQQPKLYFKTKNDTLSYNHAERDNVSITFALQDYVNQEHVTSQYRLLPNQANWTTTETKTLNFSNLSPGIYQLEVKAINQHNKQTIVKQYINVLPAWWQTMVARIGFVLLALLCLYLLFLYMKKRIQKKEYDKAQQEKRVAGLELKALRSQMNPHFVHNSLNAIQYFIQRNEVELSENYLSKFSQLIRLFFEYSRRQTVTINEELELLTNYLEIEKLRFEEKLNYRVSVCEKIDIEEQLIPSMLLQPIVENAVNHGLFHKKDNGTVKILFKQLKEDTYQVTIKDDGIGINKAKSVYKASSKNYQSNSSKVLYERLDLLNKSKEWTIKYEIQDLSDIDMHAKGTIVSLIFKQNIGE
ncbi:sensor histidine kinase [Marixanthomonas ophiurae]|uniref:Signal transduction histidine kinase internal region domain-containing protein n=1 Tax=Marixanthomonas ophiurae TaxID=387659 RepID=A0A3E1Q9I5_9FLAO|nr:histidine kinase [Marixanthomonas ophiurae]RFN58796.1 hypothetical protein DZ858_01570 [Marixanthomonas ophiurae]